MCHRLTVHPFPPDTNMMEARDPNDPSKTMFKVLQISLACPACMEAGRASECTHSKLELFFFAVAPRVLFLTLLSLCPLFSGKVQTPLEGKFLLFVFPTFSDSSDTHFKPPQSASKYAMVKTIYAQNKNMFERESMGKCLPFLRQFFLYACAHTHFVIPCRLKCGGRRRGFSGVRRPFVHEARHSRKPRKPHPFSRLRSQRWRRQQHFHRDAKSYEEHACGRVRRRATGERRGRA